MDAGLETVKFYYDFKSPFTYLAFEPALDLERTHRARLRFIPHVFDFTAYGGTLAERDERSWRKVRYLYLDARRCASERGIIIKGPQRLFDSRLALISGLFADREGRFREYAGRVWELFFKRELDIEKIDELEPLIARAGMDTQAFRRYAENDGPRDLAAAHEEAERDKVFGVPTFIVADEPFWGNDRVEWVAKKLDAMGLRRS